MVRGDTGYFPGMSVWLHQLGVLYSKRRLQSSYGFYTWGSFQCILCYPLGNYSFTLVHLCAVNYLDQLPRQAIHFFTNQVSTNTCSKPLLPGFLSLPKRPLSNLTGAKVERTWGTHCSISALGVVSSLYSAALLAGCGQVWYDLAWGGGKVLTTFWENVKKKKRTTLWYSDCEDKPNVALGNEIG